MQKRLAKLGLMLATAGLLAACSSGSGRSLLALEDEKTDFRTSLAQKIGVSKAEVDQALNSTELQEQKSAALVMARAKQRHGLSQDKAMQDHLQQVATTLAAASGAYDKQFEVVFLRSSAINAFTPGAGKLLVNEGLLRFTQTEAQVAAVLAHEIAHVLMKHPQRQRQIRLASKAGSRMMDELSEDPRKENLFSRMLRVGGNVTMNGMIRQQEMMADSIGIDIMAKAGYDPREMIRILTILRLQLPQRDRATNAQYGNHPLTIDREKAARAKVAKHYPTAEGIVSTPMFDGLAKRYHQKRMASRQ
jgi:predicted Zn-dependent protease